MRCSRKYILASSSFETKLHDFPRKQASESLFWDVTARLIQRIIFVYRKGDIVKDPMKSISFVPKTNSSRRCFLEPFNRLSVDWHRSKRCIFIYCIAGSRRKRVSHVQKISQALESLHHLRTFRHLNTELNGVIFFYFPS